MAVKVKVVVDRMGTDDSSKWLRADRLLPTVEEVGDRLQGELLNYAPIWHTKVIANDVTLGHVLLNQTIPGSAPGPESLPGQTGKAADAGHVHRFPTLEELNALEKEHEDVWATENQLGHIYLTSEIEDSANLGTPVDDRTAPRAAAVIERINSVHDELMEHIVLLQAGVKYYGSFDFGWTGSADTDKDPSNDKTPTDGFTPFIIDAEHVNPYLPINLAKKYCNYNNLSEAEQKNLVITLFDFTNLAEGTGFRFYSVKPYDSALDWGAGESILDYDLSEGNTEPPNGTQIGITRCFVDIDKNTDSLNLAGHAIYSRTTHSWDFYPDEEHSIDNKTIVVNAAGQRKVAAYAIKNPAINPDRDYLDFDLDAAAQEHEHYQWIESFFHKIRGLRADIGRLDTELDHASEELTFDEQALTDADWAPSIMIL